MNRRSGHTHIPFSTNNFDFEDHRILPDTSRRCHGLELPAEPAQDVGFDSLGPPLFPATRANDVNYVPAPSLYDFNEEPVFSSEPRDHGSFDPSSSLAMGMRVGGQSPSSSEGSVSSDPVLKYISQMLMEDNMEEIAWNIPNGYALLNTEKSLYDVLGEKYPDFSNQNRYLDGGQLIELPNSNFSSGSSSRAQDTVGVTVTCGDSSSSSLDSHWRYDLGRVHSPHQFPQSNLSLSAQFYANPPSSSISVLNSQVNVSEDAGFLPSSHQSDTNPEDCNADLPSPLRGIKVRGREDRSFEEVRATKQSVSHAQVNEAELSDMFDKVLLCTDEGEPLFSTTNCSPADASTGAQPIAPTLGSKSGRGRRSSQGYKSSVDLRNLLLLCAQAVSSSDLRTSNELLKQIRENSSPSGDGCQRSAHYFANGLEARMLGNLEGTKNYFSSFPCKKRSAADMLRAYHIHLSTCPFKKFSIHFLNHMIGKVSETASVLHVVDFGISFGFPWPILIQKLGERAGGPPKLRITGIELPQCGFRPTERNEETGRRLARYCERFRVPFQYNTLTSKNWEAIKIEDLKIESGEMVVVNCLSRLHIIPDETVEEDSPRDKVLNLIRKIKPAVFVHDVSNGAYNAPFFVTRFREALFQLSSIYDMFDATMTGKHKDSHARMILESEYFGREIMNVTVCEGLARVERPETYKQWQVRHTRASFKQLPLDPEIMKKLRHDLKAWYHKDFILDQDGNWMLFGWRGRIIYATTCWVPI